MAQTLNKNIKSNAKQDYNKIGVVKYLREKLKFQSRTNEVLMSNTASIDLVFFSYLLRDPINFLRKKED